MNSNREHKVDRLFREGLGEGSVPPPPDVWRNVAAEIGGEPRRRRGGWIFFLSGAAAASLFAAIGYQLFIQPSQAGNGNQLANSFADQHSKFQILGDSCDPSPIQIGPANADQPLLVQYNPQQKLPGQSHLKGGANLAEQNTNGTSQRVDFPLLTQEDRPTQLNGNQPGEQPKPRNIRDFLNLPLQTPQQGNPRSMADAKDLQLEKPLEPDLFTPLNKEKEFGWAIAGNFSPDFMNLSNYSVNVEMESFAGLNTNATDLGQFNAANEGTSVQEKVVTAYSTGIRLSKSVAPRVQMQTGINYASRSGKLPLQNVNDQTQTGVSLYSAQLLEVPVLARYNWVDGKKVKLFLTTGASAQWVLNSKEYVTVNHFQEEVDQAEPSAIPNQLNWVMGTGVELLPLPRVGIQLEPMLRYGILKNDIPGQPSRSVGTSLNTGLNFHF